MVSTQRRSRAWSKKELFIALLADFMSLPEWSLIFHTRLLKSRNEFPEE